MGFLDGHSGIVTGAARGFGLASARKLLSEGAGVALVDVLAEEVESQVAALRRDGHDAIAIVADVADEADVARMVETAVGAFGKLTFIHQNAAIQVEKPLHDTSLGEWNQLISVNLTSMFLGARAVIPHMLRGGGGSIVNSASVLALAADQILPAYTASKHGVLGLTRAIAVTEAYATAGIRCNCICPGDIRTEMVERYWAASPDSARAEADTLAYYPVRRIGRPEEMADTVAFLVSDRSSFINGTSIVVDGGVMAKVY